MKKMILLVEDNDDDVALTRRAFEKHRLANAIVVASDGQHAVDLLHGPQPMSPTVIDLDLNLPKLSGPDDHRSIARPREARMGESLGGGSPAWGLDVLRRLRADPRTELMPVVVLTSSDHDRDVIESYRLGANSFIKKPVDFLEFVEAARQLGLYWLILNEPPNRTDV